MNRITLTTISLLLLLTVAACTQNDYRYIHNCDGTDLLGNIQNGFRPLSVADLNAYVDHFCEGDATTLMVCSGSDSPNYRSGYGRCLGDNRGGTIDNCGDTMALNYYINLQRLEAEGTDFLRAYMTRTKEHGREAFITYRMNDLHSCDPGIPNPIWASDFWGSHPEYYVGDEGHGWNREGALNFAFPEVRQQKYNMIAEQLEQYSDIMDGFEMDFCRFVVYFPLGEGWANREKITSLVRKVKAKTDSVSSAAGHKILLTVRVPSTWLSCMDCGLDVRTWVKEGLVDFVSLAVHWKGDPAIDADCFRKESGIGRRIPVYATLDDGSFWPREPYTHGEMRGAASFALSHGADGIYLFNYFYGTDIASGGGPVVENGVISRTICPSLMKELCSLDSLEGLNKTYSYYSGNAEYGLSYKTPMPLHPSRGSDENMTFHIGDKTLPSRAVLFYRTTAGADLAARFNGYELQHSAEDTDLPAKYGKADKLDDDKEAGCFIIPGNILQCGDNSVVISTDTTAVTVSKLELMLDFGDVAEHGYY